MKTIKRVIASILLSITILTGCGKKELEQPIITEIPTETAIEENSIVDFVERDEIDNKIINVDDISVITSFDVIPYLEYFKELTFTYKNEEYYITYDKVKDIYEQESIKECNYIFDGNIVNLVNIIDSNNLLSTLTRDLLINILTDFYENNTNDINEDFHKFLSLKIVELDDYLEPYQEALYDDLTNTIYLSIPGIKFVSTASEVTYKKELKHVIEHELNHVRSESCPCKEYTTLNYEDDHIITFLYETAAEGALVNQDKSIIDTYDEYLSYENELLMLGLYNQKDLSYYYDSIFDNRYKDVYKFLHINDLDSLYELYKIIYNIDTLNFRTKLSEQIDLDEYTDNTFKLSLFKLCIINNLEYIASHNEITLEEALVVYNVIKNNLANDLFDYDDNCDRVYDLSIRDKMVEMDNKFIEYLSKHFDVSEEEIRHKELVYATVVISCINYYLNGEYSTDNYFYKDVENIITKYPMVKKVLSHDYINPCEYENYLAAKRVN